MHECECRDCDRCNAHPGPAAFEITRDGKRMRVCTRCILSEDIDRLMIVSKTDPVTPYFEWDPLGAFTLALRMTEDDGGAS